MTAKRTIDNDPMYSAAERAIYNATLKASFLRAAAIIDKITQADVEHAQVEMVSRGASLLQASKVDRALLASTHLRAIANGEVG